MHPIINSQGLIKSYSSHLALDNVSISIPKQSVFGLLGPNGAGKTTFIRLLTQITKPDSGSIYFENRPLSVDDIYNIGYMPEERGLYKKMNVGEQALYLAQLKGLSRADAIKRLKYWFEKFEITSWWGKKIEDLSKGMQQKVQFIVTVIHEPRLIILDEPFSGFDPINADLIKEELLDIQKKGATIILSTHRMESVEELCTDIALINKSRVLISGSINEIVKQYSDHTYEISFKGAPYNEVNTDIKVIETKSTDDEHTIRLKLNGNSLNDTVSRIMYKAKIISLKEIVPSMNEIFVRTVKSDSHE